jgi:hypothetical protein
MNTGYGIWIVEDRVWCRAIDGADECVMVLRTREEAEMEAKRQSEMYALGPCEARPFDWDAERDETKEKT